MITSMTRTVPPKLQKGDEIRVVAPSTSLADFDEETVELARSRFTDLGLKVSFSKHAFELDEYNSSSVRSRISDLHEAFADRKIKAVLAASGGYNANQLLRHLDYGLIRKNPKIVCGFSDITTLSVAIHAKTGLVTYSGPDFASFGVKKGLKYTLEYFQKCLMSEDPFEVVPSQTWSNDPLYKDQVKRIFIKNEGYLSINEGEVEGIIIGGNLDTFNLLQGTEFMPAQKNAFRLLI